MIWNLPDYMYYNMTSAASCNGIHAKWFRLFRGVRQGSALSAKRYMILINDLIDRLEHSKCGAFILDTNASSPVQADDIALINLLKIWY